MTDKDKAAVLRQAAEEYEQLTGIVPRAPSWLRGAVMTRPGLTLSLVVAAVCVLLLVAGIVLYGRM